MSETKSTSVKSLALDLRNYRTIPQIDEISAVHAMISISPEYFFGLMESLINDGYLPTENIIVLRQGTETTKLIVREGNRRIAALKLIFGYLPILKINLPDHIKNKINSISDEWKKANQKVPCAIYESIDAVAVDRIVTLAHGKGEKASRDQWSAVARARHNRDVKKLTESALDVLEKYLMNGNNFTIQQRERWAGDFPISVLDEAIKKLSTRFGVNTSSELAKKYPIINHREKLDEIIKAIGQESLGFKAIRDGSKDFAADYGLPLVSSQNTSTDNGQQENQQTGPKEAKNQGSSNTASGTQTDNASNKTTTASSKSAAYAINDPRSVTQILKNFKLVGVNRQKVVTLRDEALKLNLKNNPIAFCFLIRSMFEISAKAYCVDHASTSSLSATKSDGMDRNLVDILRDITAHMTTLPDGKKNQPMLKILHGPLTELAKSDSVLSVTSMNQLVHNPTFSVNTSDVCTMFGNVFPLLFEMNK